MDNLIVGKAALAVVDMQNDFVDEEAGSYALGAETMVARIARLIDAARGAGTPVIFSQEAHRASGVDGGRLLWDGRSGWVTGAHPRAEPGEKPAPPCIEGTKGFEIVDALEPDIDDVRIVKRRFSIFFGTELDQILRRLEVETLLIVGVCSDVCVLWTAGDACQRDYHVRVLEDCVAGTSSESHEAALKLIRSLTTFGDKVTSAEVIEALEQRRPDAAI
jgi:nicotinamidase-related amidase